MKLEFENWKDLSAEIGRLETALDLPHSGGSMSMPAGHRRLAELRHLAAKLAEKKQDQDHKPQPPPLDTEKESGLDRVSAGIKAAIDRDLPMLPARVTETGLFGMERACAGIKAEIDRTLPLRVARVVPSTKQPTRDQLLQIIAIADPAAAREVMTGWSDSEVKAEAEACLFRAHLHAPFMRDQATLSSEMWRSDASTIKGSARMVRGLRQEAVNKILQ